MRVRPCRARAGSANKCLCSIPITKGTEVLTNFAGERFGGSTVWDRFNGLNPLKSGRTNPTYIALVHNRTRVDADEVGDCVRRDDWQAKTAKTNSGLSYRSGRASDRAMSMILSSTPLRPLCPRLHQARSSDRPPHRLKLETTVRQILRRKEPISFDRTDESRIDLAVSSPRMMSRAKRHPETSGRYAIEKQAAPLWLRDRPSLSFSSAAALPATERATSIESPTSR